ncbi:MAG TPA: methyltransferase domain-containing protein [Thermoanaerobaculia bacterium]|nr:methyltransferase domain-containing protein [Thermoanaerobaculia bacterium]
MSQPGAMRCSICESNDTELFLERNGVPVHQNVPFDDADAARRTIRGDLHMAVCRKCGFVFNAAFDPEKIVYDEEYENSQICSDVFSDHVDGLVRRIVDELGVRNQTVVEVGCGKGYFLEKIVAADPGNRGIGFDPTYIGELSREGGRLTFERRFFGEDVRDVHPEAVVCRHVIEHVPDPAAMLRSIRAQLGERDALVVFETPCVEWILRNRVVWDFFYEHCSLFSASSLATLFERTGFRVDAVTHVFDGQYLWLEARPARGAEAVTNANGLVELCRAFGAHERELVASWSERVQALARDGGVALWGAGAKGVTFANLIDPQRRWIDSVVDLNPRKQGRFVAGTGHPIVHYSAIRDRGVRNVILMNPNYERENRALAAAGGLQVEFIVD